MRVSFPFLQWNTIRWNIKISEADFESAKLDFTQAVTSALNEVDTAYFSYANAQRSLENTLSKHQKDVRIGEYYQTRYDLGAARAQGLSGRPEYGGQLHAFGAGSEIPGHPVREPDLQSDGRALRTHLAAVWRKGYTGAHVHQWRNTCSKSKKSIRRPFEDAERVFETSHPELRYAVASQRAVGFYESLKDYNENASLWVAWFEGEKPADLAAFIQQEIEKAEASVEE